MPTSPTADALVARATRQRDPARALEHIAQARAAQEESRARVVRATRDVIAAARADGMSWPAIGDRLGVSPQRAQQLAETKEAAHD